MQVRKHMLTGLGIVMAVIGFTGAIYYGSQFVKEEVKWRRKVTLYYSIPNEKSITYGL